MTNRRNLDTYTETFFNDDTQMPIEQLRDETEEFNRAQALLDEGGEGCDLCGEMVPYLRWTQDAVYLVCEVCWSEYPSGRLTQA